jgi:hypothetical protein
MRNRANETSSSIPQAMRVVTRVQEWMLIVVISACFLQTGRGQTISFYTTRSNVTMYMDCNDPLSNFRDLSERTNIWSEIQSAEFENVVSTYVKPISGASIKVNRASINPVGTLVRFDWTGLTKEETTQFLRLVNRYLCRRMMGHSKEFAEASIREAFSPKEGPRSDPFLASLKRAIPDLPFDHIQPDPLYKQPASGRIIKQFLLIDGEFAWIYVVPMGGRVTILRFDRKLYSKEWLPKLGEAMEKLDQMGEAQGRQGHPRYFTWYWTELDTILRRDYGSDHISCFELNRFTLH